MMDNTPDLDQRVRVLKRLDVLTKYLFDAPVTLTHGEAVALVSFIKALRDEGPIDLPKEWRP